MKCGKCGSDFANSDIFAKCVNCNKCYHPACSRLGSEQNFTKAKKANWRCDECMASGTPQLSEETHDGNKSILDAMQLLKNELLSAFSSQINDVKSSITEELKSIKDDILDFKNEHSALKERCAQLEVANKELAREVVELRHRVLDNEQHSRSNNLEISGLPATPRENVYEVLNCLAKALGVTYRREDISVAHRLKLFSPKLQHPPLIVQFVSRSVREVWLSAARQKRPLNTSEISAALQPGSVFVNEHLTGMNKMLLGRARKLQKDGKLHFASYSNGKVLVKRKEGENTIRVLQMEDLNQFDV